MKFGIIIAGHKPESRRAGSPETNPAIDTLIDPEIYLDPEHRVTAYRPATASQ
jgi:hypothetical protein